MRCLSILITFCLLSSLAQAKETIKTHLNKSATGAWSVSYQSSGPVKKLAFKRNPDNSRQKRWTPLSDDFQISYEAEQEFIGRKDGTSFTTVSFDLQATYTHLPKDYGPFSPFSDGGILVHSGRFFVCDAECTDEDIKWKFSLSAPAGDHIILQGQVKSNSVNWQAKDDGQNIYVGQQLPIDTDQIIAVVDEVLPQKLKSALNAAFPRMMRYFERNLGKLPRKPMLFASYGETQGGSYGSQGGTLPDQVFMHWYGNQLNNLMKDESYINEMTWFYAHEAGHLYQKNKGVAQNEQHAWIHEGHADQLAAMALRALFPELKPYVAERLKQAQDQCFTGLEKMALNEASSKDRFDLHYACGLHIHDSIDRTMREADRNSKGAITLWNAYQESIAKGQPPGQKTFFATLAKLTTRVYANALKQFVNAKQVPFELIPGAMGEGEGRR